MAPESDKRVLNKDIQNGLDNNYAANLKATAAQLRNAGFPALSNDEIDKKIADYYAQIRNKSGANNSNNSGDIQSRVLPMPFKKEALVQGQTYLTPRGPAIWDGSNFQK